MMRFLVANKTALLLLSGMLLRDLWCLCAAKIYCWRKRRQTQRQALREQLQRRKQADERAAHIHEIATRQKTPSTLDMSAYIFITPARNLECLVLPTDRKRFPVLNDDELDEKGKALNN